MRAQALINGLRVLEFLQERGTARFGKLQALVGVSAPTASAILRELCCAGYVRKRHDGYELGTQFLTMANAVLEQFDLRDYAHDELVALRDVSHETAELAVADGRDVLFVDRCTSPQQIRLRARIGYRTPILHGFAVGKVSLAYMPEPERRRYCRCMSRACELLPPQDRHESDAVRAVLPQAAQEVEGRQESDRLPAVARCTIRSIKVLEEQLPRIRAAKVCIEVEEGRDGVARVSAPILDHRGSLAGILSVACLTFRTDDAKIQLLKSEVRSGAERVSRAIGYTEGW